MSGGMYGSEKKATLGKDDGDERRGGGEGRG